MKARRAILVTAVAMSWIAAATVSAQTLNPPYLREMPSAERVKAEIKGSDPIDTAARQAGAFWQLRRMIYDLALTQHRTDRQTTPDEQRIANGYYAAYYDAWQPVQKLLAQDRPQLFKLEGYATHPDILKEVLERFFSPAYRAGYYKAMADMDARIKARQDADPIRVKPSTNNQPNTVSQSVSPPSGSERAGALTYKVQGDTYVEANDFPRAIDAYKKALALDPTLYAAYYGLGVAAINVKQYQESNAAFKQCVFLKPNDPLALILLGITYRELKQYPEATIAFQAAIRLKPDSKNLANAYYHLGATYTQMRNKTAAVQVYSALQGIDPARAQQLAELINQTNWESPQPSASASTGTNSGAVAYLNQGYKYFEAKDYSKAIEAFQTALTLQPDQKTLGSLRSWMCSTYRELNQYDNAVGACQEAVRLKPNDSDARFGLGWVYYLNKQFPNALTTLEEANRLKPDAETQYWIGETYRTGLNQQEKALAAFRECLRLRPNDARTINQIGLVSTNLSQYPNAVTAFREAIRLKPSEALYYSNLGIAYVRMGKKDEALQVYKALQPLDKAKAQDLYALIEKPNQAASKPGPPVNPEAQPFFDQGRKLLDAKQYAKAVEAYKKGLSISPSTASAQLNLGSAYYELEQYENASAAFQQVVRLTPNDPNAHAWVGLAYAALGQYEKAIEADREAVRLDPKVLEYYASLGEACRRGGRFLDSAAAYQQVVRLKPDDALYQYFLGFAYVVAGKKAEAMQVYNALLKLDEDQAKDLLEDINEKRGPAAILIKFGQIYSLMHGETEALAAFRNALRLKPTDKDVLFDLGIGFSTVQHYDEAMAVYRSIIAMNPDAETLSSAYYAIGSDYYDMKEYQKALAALQQARRIKPSYLQSDKMGQVYADLKQDQNALSAFQDAVRLKPEYGDGYLHLGQRYTELKQYDKALVALKEAARLSPKDSRPHYEMGVVYFFQGQYPNAVTEFSEAIRIFPKHTMALMGLGSTYRVMGKKNEALKVYATLKPIDAKIAQELLNGINQMK